jgi:dTDP-4-dehydrorhamnose 3,5-epimerase-like enzyme
MENQRWIGLRAEAQDQLEMRQYARAPLAERLRTIGVEAGEIVGGPSPELTEAWIPGVEIFARRVFQQRHRGYFAEFARQDDPTSRLHQIGMWPKQWATALMDAGTAKGFHIHPPHIPDGVSAEAWFQRLFINEPGNFSLRPYAQEQWDAMFFIRGVCEMFLIDERVGLPRRKMRFIIEGDQRPGSNNVGVIIPAGVAHSLRSASSEDVIMVYGTSTQFDPANEGRLCSEVEQCPVPEPWQTYWEK